MPVIEFENLDRRNKDSIHLLKSARDFYSQCGEDGIIEKIFAITEPRNKWCVEFGAWDGIKYSNTARLIREFNWTGVQIEGSKAKFEELEKNFGSLPNSIRICDIVGYEKGKDTIDDILVRTDIPKDFDLISIDIDGNDWFIWESIVEYRPRIVVIEFNPMIPNDVVFIQDRDFQINEGCSLAALVRLGKAKGYELICATNLNGIFVVKEEYEKFGIENNSVDAMFVNPQGRIFCTYSGKIYQTMRKFAWTIGKIKPTPDMFQVLPPDAMNFKDGISNTLKEN